MPYTTAERDTYDQWVRINRMAPTTIPTFVARVRDEERRRGQVMRPIALYQLRMTCVRLTQKGALITSDPDTMPLMSRKYQPVSPPPWGPRRPGSRVHP